MISIGSMKVKYSITLLFASLLFSLPAYSSTRYTYTERDTESNKYLFKLEDVSCSDYESETLTNAEQMESALI